MESVDTPDKQTVVFHLKNPVGPFLRITSFLSIAPSEVLAAKGPDEYGAGVVLPGTGPFKIKNFAPGDSLTLATNSDYWGKKPKIEGLQFVNIPSRPRA